jgi:hypothetical protein
MIQRRKMNGFAQRNNRAVGTLPSRKREGHVSLQRRELVCTIAQFATCQWMDANAPSRHSAMCGAATLQGKPYCAGHWARAWQPATLPGQAVGAES